jgi:hypothetical protein
MPRVTAGGGVFLTHASKYPPIAWRAINGSRRQVGQEEDASEDEGLGSTRTRVDPARS